MVFVLKDCVGIGLLFLDLVKHKVGTGNFVPQDVQLVFHTRWNALFSTRGGMLCFPHEVECLDRFCPLELALFST
jgi:hypothetical protein